MNTPSNVNTSTMDGMNFFHHPGVAPATNQLTSAVSYGTSNGYRFVTMNASGSTQSGVQLGSETGIYNSLHAVQTTDGAGGSSTWIYHPNHPNTAWKWDDYSTSATAFTLNDSHPFTSTSYGMWRGMVWTGTTNEWCFTLSSSSPISTPSFLQRSTVTVSYTHLRAHET